MPLRVSIVRWYLARKSGMVIGWAAAAWRSDSEVRNAPISNADAGTLSVDDFARYVVVAARAAWRAACTSEEPLYMTAPIWVVALVPGQSETASKATWQA